VEKFGKNHLWIALLLMASLVAIQSAWMFYQKVTAAPVLEFRGYMIVQFDTGTQVIPRFRFVNPTDRTLHLPGFGGGRLGLRRRNPAASEITMNEVVVAGGESVLLDWYWPYLERGWRLKIECTDARVRATDQSSRLVRWPSWTPSSIRTWLARREVQRNRWIIESTILPPSPAG
jgi:hypothetical protein